jgi:hypothetical protein
MQRRAAEGVLLKTDDLVAARIEHGRASPTIGQGRCFCSKLSELVDQCSAMPRRDRVIGSVRTLIKGRFAEDMNSRNCANDLLGSEKLCEKM